MSNGKEMVFLGRRDGAVVGFWRNRPTMMDVEVKDRMQDADLVFEEISEDHPDVVAFLNRPMKKFDPEKALANANGSPGQR